jgi:hypothetical protein
MRSSVLARSAVVLTLSLTPVAWPVAAQADSVPWKDPNAQGYIGLCDDKGNQLRSGKLSAKPFAHFAISSVAAPTGYGVQERAKGTLFAYQPRPGVDPGDWSGTQLTASSFFSNPSHPMAEGTAGDYSLADYLSIYPAKVDGLVQLRMFLGAPNKQTITTPYPATTIRVSGDSWRVVEGGSISCGVGQATSIEKVYLPKQTLASLAATPSPSASSSRGDNGASAGGTSDTASTSRTAEAASSSADHSSASWLWPALGGLVAATALLLLGRRFRTGRARTTT